MNLEVLDLALVSSTLPPETLKNIMVWKPNLCWIQEPPAQSLTGGPFEIRYLSTTTPNHYTRKYQSNEDVLKKTVLLIGNATRTFSYDPDAQSH